MKKGEIVGKAIVEQKTGEKPEQKLNSERDRLRRRGRWRVFLSVFGIVIVVGVLAVLTGILVKNVKIRMEEERARMEAELIEAETYEPTVKIVDENESGDVSKRVRDYVGMLEADMKDFGYEIERVVLPEGKAREVDFYVKGISYYFKGNIDRGTAVTAEDAVRIIKYFGENEIKPEKYVDVRVEGKAFYK